MEVAVEIDRSNAGGCAHSHDRVERYLPSQIPSHVLHQTVTIDFSLSNKHRVKTYLTTEPQTTSTKYLEVGVLENFAARYLTQLTDSR